MINIMRGLTLADEPEDIMGGIREEDKEEGAYRGPGFQLARTQEQAEELWSDRKNAHYAGLALAPGAKGWPTDV
jgi:hypothetical protein